ncbi:MAG: hypothetical protein IPL58_03695 [Betaproteobacteria bacterium]|uniref:D-isomer specific 2-hydroxyacid dehydrogenase catalytic domain-containing protein n=1 Tax=Candidatus Proximibacter danicus TaxID=2954365 RepID=A0A9D7JYW8_9PROT|nr:hypothetical protein [Candidatus Proximibacter danicus]
MLFAHLGFRLMAEYMDRCPRLKVIASNTTGIPHIDAIAAEMRGVAVAHYDEQIFLDTDYSTAEHTVGLMLAAARRLPAAHAAGMFRSWDRKRWEVLE